VEIIKHVRENRVESVLTIVASLARVFY